MVLSRARPRRAPRPSRGAAVAAVHSDGMPFFSVCELRQAEWRTGNWWLAVAADPGSPRLRLFAPCALAAAPVPSLDALIFGWIEDSRLASASHGWIRSRCCRRTPPFGLCGFCALIQLVTPNIIAVGLSP